PPIISSSETLGKSMIQNEGKKSVKTQRPLFTIFPQYLESIQDRSIFILITEMTFYFLQNALK
ncbi:MAG: hypothetical protein LBM60_01735, partial [Clostridium sp.]|nr:hypothetical protein [Clostridium sp.]